MRKTQRVKRPLSKSKLTGPMRSYKCLMCRATMACQCQPLKCVRGCAGFFCVRQD